MDLKGICAAMYLRKSRAEDGMATDEILRRHRETLEEYAESEGIIIVDVFPEVKSGESLLSRPMILKLLENVEGGKYQAVLCMDLDRLSRGGTRDRGLLWETFKLSGTLIITPSKAYDLREESDEMLAEFYGLVASMELAQIKKRLKRGKERALREGLHLCHPPYGYRRATIGGRSTLEIYEPEAQYVRKIFLWYSQGYGCDSIAQKLNALGVRPKIAAQFERGTILKMVKNAVYIGKIVSNRTHWNKKNGKLNISPVPREEWIESDGLHKGIIDPSLFYECQEILAGRYRPSHDGSIKFSMVGLIYCERCGSRIQRAPRRDVAYIRCIKKGCSCGSRQDYVEAALITALENELSRLESNKEQGADEIVKSMEDELTSIGAALAEAERRKTMLFDLLEDGTYSRKDFLSRMDKLKERVSVLEKARETTSARLEAAKNADKQAQAAKIRTALDEYPIATPERQNAILHEIVQEIWYGKDKGSPPAQFSLRIVLKF